MRRLGRPAMEPHAIAPDGVGEYEAFAIYGKLTWQLTAASELRFTAGAALGGELTLEDDDGLRLAESELPAHRGFEVLALVVGELVVRVRQLDRRVRPQAAQRLVAEVAHEDLAFVEPEGEV